MSRKYSIFQRTEKSTAIDPSSVTWSRSAGSPDGAFLRTQGSTTSPLSANKIEKRQSRRGIFDLFSKPKVEVARGYQESGSVNMPSKVQKSINYFRPPSQESPLVSSRSNLSLHARPGLSHGRISQSLLTDQETPWDPPPLFQAYPQAIKHGISQGLSASPQDIERAQQYRNNPLIQDALGLASSKQLAPVLEDDASLDFNLASRRYPTVADVLNVSRKHYVLVTTGRLLQYAGSGKSDRMPEKVLHLGPSSAAFACDLISGKHWVLQVMQQAEGTEAPNPRQSRSFMSKLKFSGLSARRNVSSLLMIFDGGEEMDAWLKAIRKAIHELGGTSFVEPIPGESQPDADLRLQPRLMNPPSHRYNIQRDPRAPSRLGSTAPSVMSSTSNDPETPVENTDHRRLSPQSSSAPPMPIIASSPAEKRTSQALSTEGMSVGTSSMSSENFRLDQLKEGSRYSLVSALSETDTRPTSRSSSSPPSPLAPGSPISEKINASTALQKAARKSVYGHVAHVPSMDSETTLRPVMTPDQASTSSDEVLPANDIEQSLVMVEVKAATEVEIMGLHAGDGTPSPQSPGLKVSMPPVPEDSEDENAVRPISTVGQLPIVNIRRTGSTRIRPFARPIPVKPSCAKLSTGNFVPANDKMDRNMTSLSMPSPVSQQDSSTLRKSTDSSFPITTRPQRRTIPATFSLIPNIEPSPSKPPSPPQALQQALRRPSSVQVNSGHIAFLSTTNSRSARGGSRSASVSPSPPTQRHSQQSSPPEDARRREAHLRRESFTQYMLAAQRARLANATATGPILPPLKPVANLNLRGRASLPAMNMFSLPPPMPPPTCPLPAPPTGAQAR